jgi:small subunit ribosomal protein S9
MTDEQNNETSEQPEGVEETAEGADAATAGPVAEGDSPANSPESPPSTPPADEAAEEPTATDDETAEQDGPATEEPMAEEQGDAVEAEPAAEAESEEPEAPVEKPKAEKKADVIPGADLEPIAVEPEAQLSTEERARLEAEEEERARREAELAGEGAEEPSAAGRAPAKMESGARFLATGKRKSAIARVTLTPGGGKFEVNKRDLSEFFPRPLHQTMARQALVVSGYEGNVDVRVLVHGGGISGQAGAVRHGIARALIEIDPELRGDLKRRGFLTRDARVKERRKAGFKKARKKPQFSKR